MPVQWGQPHFFFPTGRCKVKSSQMLSSKVQTGLNPDRADQSLFTTERKLSLLAHTCDCTLAAATIPDYLQGVEVWRHRQAGRRATQTGASTASSPQRCACIAAGWSYDPACWGWCIPGAAGWRHTENRKSLCLPTWTWWTHDGVGQSELSTSVSQLWMDERYLQRVLRLFLSVSSSEALQEQHPMSEPRFWPTYKKQKQNISLHWRTAMHCVFVILVVALA